MHVYSITVIKTVITLKSTNFQNFFNKIQKNCRKDCAANLHESVNDKEQIEAFCLLVGSNNIEHQFSDSKDLECKTWLQQKFGKNVIPGGVLGRAGVLARLVFVYESIPADSTA